MSDILLCPSIMCSDVSNLEKEILALDEAGIDIFHNDIMDGTFVPNFGMGLEDFKLVRRLTDQLVDVHLMIMDPGKYVAFFADLGADIIYVHPEADMHPARTLFQIRQLGKLAGLAINPGTSLETVLPLLSLADYILVMTVNPGFAGQKYLEFVDEKIIQLIEQKPRYHYKLIADGAISKERLTSLHERGVEGFVLGTSALFNKGVAYKTIADDLRGKRTVEI